MNSVRARYFAKLSNNMVGMLGGIVTALLVPKSLGPAHYGDFNFLKDSFDSLVRTMDMNASSAHFTYSSRNKESGPANQVYFYFSILVGIALAVLVGAAIFSGAASSIWPGQGATFVFAGAALGFLAYLASNLTNLSDSRGFTVAVENQRRLIVALSMLILLAMYFSGLLGLASFFSYSIAVQAAMVLLSAALLKRAGVFGFGFKRVGIEDIKSTARYFYGYSSPLVTALVIGLVLGFFDRWLLQAVGGSATQGHYSLALKLSMVCALFTNSMAPVFSQSVASAHASGDMGRVRDLFGKVRVFYFTAAFISVFFVFHAEEIVFLVGGDEYGGATLPVTVMMFYPIHQAFGQLFGSAVLSMQFTNIYRNVSILSSSAGLVLSVFLVAPPGSGVPGLGMGAAGLAIKVVALQVLSSNLMLFYACRKAGFGFAGLAAMQVVLLLPVLGIGYLSSFAGGLVLWAGGMTAAGAVGRLVLDGSAYVLGSAILCLAFPALLGIKREDMRGYARAFLMKGA
ncbi:MAG: hypothetical protein HS130_04295 [Deltaproteobacteria bacterium]|nr:hypothetical protein [Deltaproteobacteria bacterium]MCL4873353.1 hypothetical protein [bacterium]